MDDNSYVKDNCFGLAQTPKPMSEIECLRLEVNDMWKRVSQLSDAVRALRTHENLKPVPCEPQTEDLTFGDALEWLRKNWKITRASWRNEKIYVYLWNGAAIDSPDGWMPELRVKTISGKHACWMPNHQELLAVDWRAIP